MAENELLRRKITKMTEKGFTGSKWLKIAKMAKNG